MSTHVWLHNAETGGTWACPGDVVAVFKARGWEPIEAPDVDTAGLYDDPPVEVAKPDGPKRAGKNRTAD